MAPNEYMEFMAEAYILCSRIERRFRKVGKDPQAVSRLHAIWRRALQDVSAPDARRALDSLLADGGLPRFDRIPSAIAGRAANVSGASYIDRQRQARLEAGSRAMEDRREQRAWVASVVDPLSDEEFARAYAEATAKMPRMLREALDRSPEQAPRQNHLVRYAVATHLRPDHDDAMADAVSAATEELPIEGKS
jgi:hypothetical protein